MKFGDIIQAINRLDTDVITIENSRINNRTPQVVTDYGLKIHHEEDMATFTQKT